MNSSAYIEELLKIAKKEGNKYEITVLEENISNNLEEAINDEKFFELPMEYILNIVKISDEDDITVFKNLISKACSAKGNEASLLLTAISLPHASISDYISVISSLDVSPLCKQIGEKYIETDNIPIVDYSRENSELRKEIVSLNALLKEYKDINNVPKPDDFREDVIKAVEDGDIDSVKYHIQVLKVDVEKRYKTGNKLIHIAAFKDRLKIFRYLVENCKADYTTGNYIGLTPLHNAARGNSCDIAKYLIEECCVPVDVPDKFNRTPAFLAAKDMRTKVLQYLVTEANANINITDEYNRTPLSIAVKNNYIEVVRILVEEAHAVVTQEILNEASSDQMTQYLRLHFN